MTSTGQQGYERKDHRRKEDRGGIPARSARGHRRTRARADCAGRGSPSSWSATTPPPPSTCGTSAAPARRRASSRSRTTCPVSTTEAELLALIDRLNADPAIDGILVQLPLPKHVASVAVLERIDPAKDVDGFHPYNVGRLLQQNTADAALHALRNHPVDGTRRPRDPGPQRGRRRAEATSSASRWRSSS